MDDKEQQRLIDKWSPVLESKNTKTTSILLESQEYTPLGKGRETIWGKGIIYCPYIPLTKIKYMNDETSINPADIDYSEMVATLAKDGQTITDEMTASDAHLLHMAVGVSGEAGELIDAVKKATIYRKELDIENVIEELGDLEFYMEGIRGALGITREATIDANKIKLGKRYNGFKYSDKQAHDRADKA